MSQRLLPNPNALILTVNGRVYSGTAGTAVDGVPDIDAVVLTANGWTILNPASTVGSGTGGNSTAVWGGIAGNMPDQGDLNTALTAKVSTAVAYTAANNSLGLASGVAPPGGALTAIVTDLGIVAMGTIVDGIASTRNGSQIVWNAAQNKYLHYMSANVGPVAQNGGNVTLLDAHDDVYFNCSNTPAFSLGNGRVPGLAVQIDGNFTLSGPLTFGNGVIDDRITTGVQYCCLVNSSLDGYRAKGTK